MPRCGAVPAVSARGRARGGVAGGAGPGRAGAGAVAAMERLERSGRCLRAALARGRVRRRLPVLLLAIAVLGSALKDSDLVPDTPLQNKRNPLNV